MRGLKSITVGAVFILVVGGLVSGCSSKRQADVEIVPPDISTWALPLDSYDSANSMLVEYARALILDSCMKEKGYWYPVVPYNESAPGSITRNEVGHRLFNVNIAKRVGYHEDRPHRYSQKLAQTIEPATGKEADLAYEECVKQVKAAGLHQDDEDYQTVFNIRDHKASTETSTVREARQRWHKCMLPLALPGQPDDPEKMPPAPLEEKFKSGDSVEWNAPPASAEEIRIAVADAKCRETSGYTKALYQAEYAASKKAVEENAADLEPIRERNKKLLETARKVIKERG